MAVEVSKAAMDTWSPSARVLVGCKVLTGGWLKSRRDGADFKVPMGGWSPFQPVAEVCRVLMDGWLQSPLGRVVYKAVTAGWSLFLPDTEAFRDLIGGWWRLHRVSTVCRMHAAACAISENVRL
jgi:hypothetical protein